MSSGNYFFLVFLLTIIFTRIELIPKKVHSPTIFGLRLHHYMYGLVLTALSLYFSNLTLYAIGIGLFVDELPQIITGSWRNWNDYYSTKEVLRVAMLIILVFIIKGYLIAFI